MRREDILPSVLKVFWFCFSLMLQIGRFFPLSTLDIFLVLWTYFCDVSCVVEYNSQLCCCVDMFSSLCPYFCQGFSPFYLTSQVREYCGYICEESYWCLLFIWRLFSLLSVLWTFWISGLVSDINLGVFFIFSFCHFVIMISKIPPISLFPTLLDLSRY